MVGSSFPLEKISKIYLLPFLQNHSLLLWQKNSILDPDLLKALHTILIVSIKINDH